MSTSIPVTRPAASRSNTTDFMNHHGVVYSCHVHVSGAVPCRKCEIVAAPPKDVIAFTHPFVHEFFLGERGQRAMELLREYPFTV